MENKFPISDQDIRAIELHEAENSEDSWGALNQELIAEMGIRQKRIGPALVNAVREVDVLAWNTIHCLGIGPPANESQIDEIIEFYREAGVARCFLQLCPLAQPDSVPEMLESKGFKYYNNWVKLYRTTDNIPDPVPGIEVRRIGPGDEAEQFAQILVTSFEWPASLEKWVASGAGRERWRYYLAYIDGQPAATAASYVNGELAWIDMASTLPEYRGRGAQGALIARRIADCAKEGIRLMHVEASEEKPDKPAVSQSNLLKYGFRQAYLRPNYIYSFDK